MGQRMGPVAGVALAAFLALLAPAVAGGQPVTAERATLGETGARTIEVSTAELRQILAERSATVFDARPAREFALSHIPGAPNVAAKPGVPIAVYADAAAFVATALAREAFHNVSYFAGTLEQARAAERGDGR